MVLSDLQPQVPVEVTARVLAHELLAEDPRRLHHVAGAARIARFVSRRLRMPQPEYLVSAAWIHDIGYAEPARRTGFHPVDGARYLEERGWPPLVVSLVAHHSHAHVTAPYYGADDELASITPPDPMAADVITFADVTSGVDGHGATLEERLADLRERQARNLRVPAEARERRYELLAASVRNVVAALEVNDPRTPSTRRLQH